MKKLLMPLYRQPTVFMNSLFINDSIVFNFENLDNGTFYSIEGYDFDTLSLNWKQISKSSILLEAGGSLGNSNINIEPFELSVNSIVRVFQNDEIILHAELCKEIVEKPQALSLKINSIYDLFYITNSI